MMTQEKECLEMSDEFDQSKTYMKFYDYPNTSSSSSSSPMSMSKFSEYVCDDIIDPELICRICHLPFTDPHVAKCGDTFCIGCITFWEEDHCPSPFCKDNWTKVDLKPITAKVSHIWLHAVMKNNDYYMLNMNNKIKNISHLSKDKNSKFKIFDMNLNA